MVTKSIRLSEAEAAELTAVLALVGGTESALLEEAFRRGFRELQLDHARAVHPGDIPSEDATYRP